MLARVFYAADCCVELLLYETKPDDANDRKGMYLYLLFVRLSRTAATTEELKSSPTLTPTTAGACEWKQ